MAPNNYETRLQQGDFSSCRSWGKAGWKPWEEAALVISKVVGLLCLTVEGPGRDPCAVASQRSTLCPWNVAAGSLLDFVGVLPVVSRCHCHLCTCIMKIRSFTKAIAASKQMARSFQSVSHSYPLPASGDLLQAWLPRMLAPGTPTSQPLWLAWPRFGCR